MVMEKKANAQKLSSISNTGISRDNICDTLADMPGGDEVMEDDGEPIGEPPP